MGNRTEHDSLGEVQVPDEVLWGAQTQRSLHFFAIGSERFLPAFTHAFALVKKAAALTNTRLGRLPAERSGLIAAVCDEIMQGRHDDQFPLSVWQTGSGTQTNMNLNEVIANRGNELAGHIRGSYTPLHPNDHVNMSQSSNDVFPTVMHVVTAQMMAPLLSTLQALITNLRRRAAEFENIVKSGRTHMMDATPMTLGQEFSAFAAQLSFAHDQFHSTHANVRQLALGGSAIGTGLNTHPDWAQQVADCISELSGFTFSSAPDKFMALAAHDVLVDLHGRLDTLATALFKIANDIRLMNSGPRCGLSEIRIPANEPGSSIMPGKVNPTQAEALTMVCVRVMGNQGTISMAGSQGHFQLNVYKPLIIHTLMQSIRLLTDAMRSFDEHCLQGLQPRRDQLAMYMSRSLMLVTALTPVLGYEQAAKVALYAEENQSGLREAVITLGLLSGEEFDRSVDPHKMLGPGY